MTQDNQKIVGVIEKKDIIDLKITTDPFNAPDVVIPTFSYQKSLGVQAADLFVIKSLSSGVLKNIGSKNLRVSTYDIPQFLFSPVAEAVRASEDFTIDSYEGGLPSHASSEVADKIASFFGAHARKSSLYRQKTGECVMLFRPDIIDGYAWYMIDGIKCFVSDVRHEITRSNAVTILTIAGVYDNSINTNKIISKDKSSVPDQEKSFRAKLDNKAKIDTHMIKKDVEIGEIPTTMPSGEITLEDINGIFSSSNDNATTITNLPIDNAVVFD